MAVHGAVYWIVKAEVLFRLEAIFDLSVSSFFRLHKAFKECRHGRSEKVCNWCGIWSFEFTIVLANCLLIGIITFALLKVVKSQHELG